MATTPFIRKIWKVLGWLGIATGVGTAGSLAFTLSQSLFNHNIIGIGTNITQAGGNIFTAPGSTFNFKFDKSTHYKEGDVINLNLRVVKVNQNNNSIKVRVDTPIPEENKISNIQGQGSITFDHLAVTQLFSEGNPTESNVLLKRPPSNTYWSFPPAANIYQGSGGLGLNLLLAQRETIYGNPLGSPVFLPPTTAPLPQHHSNPPTSSRESQVSNPPTSSRESQGFDSISAFLSSLFSEDESTASSNSRSCPGQ